MHGVEPRWSALSSERRTLAESPSARLDERIKTGAGLPGVDDGVADRILALRASASSSGDDANARAGGADGDTSDDGGAGFHSVEDELAVELDVEGTVPDWLDGSLIRNGPGAFDLGDRQVGHYFDGLAMLRKFAFEDGRVTYRNRFLRTDAYEEAADGEYSGGFGTDESLSLFERIRALLTPPSPTDNTNVNVWRLGGEYVGITETEFLTVFDPGNLDTVEQRSYEGEPYGQQVSGHPCHDDDRGETVSVSTYFGRQSEYRVWSQPDDSWSRETLCRLEVDKPAYIHSFGLTDRYVVLVEFPFVVSPLKLLLPSNEAFIKQFEWEPDRGTQFHVIDRESGSVVGEAVADPFFCFHHVNAYDVPDAADDVVVDMVSFEDAESISQLYFEDVDGPADLEADGASLTRCRLALDGAGGATVRRERLHDGHLGMPRVSPAVSASDYRYVYAHGERTGRVHGFPESLVKVDVTTGQAQWRDLGGYVSEPVFVPDPAGDAEDAGVALTVAFDPERDRSVLSVFDAVDLELLAEAPLPHALPMDFHGQFFLGVH